MSAVNENANVQRLWLCCKVSNNITLALEISEVKHVFFLGWGVGRVWREGCQRLYNWRFPYQVLCGPPWSPSVREIFQLFPLL